MDKNKIILVNSITLSRVILVIPIFFFTNLNYLVIVALWAGISDFLDGFLARKWEVTTALGIKLDQYADKMASLLLLVFFLNNQKLSCVFSALIFFREILVLIFRSLNWSSAHSNFFGKAKTFFFYALFVLLSLEHLVSSFFIDFKLILKILVISCSWLSVFLSIPKLTSPIIYGFGTSGLSSILLKKAPGTITSFLCFLLLFLGLNDIGLEYKISFLILLLIFHFVYYNSFLNQVNSQNDDPSIYTLDESIAIVFAWLFLERISIIDFLILFLLFRFFDIFKLLGIKKIEKQFKWSPAIRNVADDILAMAYAMIVFQIIQFYVA
jgi:phosphatidylglycerophosphate synthase